MSLKIKYLEGNFTSRRYKFSGFFAIVAKGKACHAKARLIVMQT